MNILAVILALLQLSSYGDDLAPDGFDGTTPFVYIGQNRWEFEIDNAFITDELWPEILKITGSDTSAKFPESIDFIYSANDQKSELKNGVKNLTLGTYHIRKRRISIYVLNIFRSGLDFSESKKIPSAKEDCPVYLYNVVAHELLHHVYGLSSVYSAAEEHRRMKESGNLSAAAEFIKKKFNSPGYAKAMSFNSLNFAMRHNLHVAK